MEQFLLRLLPRTPRCPAWLRYVLTLALVGLTLLVRVLLDAHLRVAPLLVFIPAVFVASVIFDRGSGVLATLASAAVAAVAVLPLSGMTAIPFAIFVLTGLMIATVTETLRRTIEKLTEARDYAEVLLQELAHRTRNDLSTIMSILRLQIHGASEPAARAALQSAISRIEVIARVHDRLQDSSAETKLRLAPYVEGLCQNLADFHRGVHPIAIHVNCDATLSLQSSRAAVVGLIVNELVTNAFKYAFPDNRPGVVDVSLERRGEHIMMTVTDDGVGCLEDGASGLGTRLVRVLAGQLNGTMTRIALPRGCRVQVLLAVEN